MIPNSKFMIRNSIVKIISLLLIVALNWTGISAIGQTLSYFNDTEDSPGNIYSAGILDMTIRSGQSNFIPPAENMKPGDSTARDIYVGKTADSLPLKHRVSFEFIEGDRELCDQLELKIWYDHYHCQGSYEECRDMRLTYNGKLSLLDKYTHSDFIIPHPNDEFDTDPSNGTEQWFYYSISLPNDTPCEFHNKTCKFKFVYEAWQENVENYEDSGFTDVEEITNTISTGDWSPEVTITYPNGGETWYMICADNLTLWSDWCLAHGMNEKCEYPITWSATNPIGDDKDLLINLYFSNDSGNSWITDPAIATNTENDGVFWWRVPCDSRYLGDNGRIKVEAFHKHCSELNNSDMSDGDFCPPVVTLQDLLIWNQTLDRNEASTTPPIFEPTLPDNDPAEPDLPDTNEETTTTEATSSEGIDSGATALDATTTEEATSTITDSTASTSDQTETADGTDEESSGLTGEVSADTSDETTTEATTTEPTTTETITAESTTTDESTITEESTTTTEEAITSQETTTTETTSAEEETTSTEEETITAGEEEEAVTTTDTTAASAEEEAVSAETETETAETNDAVAEQEQSSDAEEGETDTDSNSAGEEAKAEEQTEPVQPSIQEEEPSGNSNSSSEAVSN